MSDWRQVYLITPMGKPRMTRSDKWKTRPAVMRYRAFKDECRLRKVVCEAGDSYIFIVPMPKSWSEKKKKLMDGEPHIQVPDLDNMLKALWDAVCLTDEHLWKICGAEKRWGRVGSIVVQRNVVDSLPPTTKQLIVQSFGNYRHEQEPLSEP